MPLLEDQRLYTTEPRRLLVATLAAFGAQVRRAYADARRVRFARSYRRVQQIVIGGMGGSTLGSDVVRSVFAPSLKVPVTIVNGYDLPGSVNRQTLVLLSSYSGTTEEVLSLARAAQAKKAMITGLTQGGPLASFFRRGRYPWYQIDGHYNPARQPRTGLGYNALGQIGLLTAAGLLAVTTAEVQKLANFVDRRTRLSFPDVAGQKNGAKVLARALYGRVPVLVGADFLSGSVHAFANQLNETAKSLAVPFVVPELNHHLLEGLRFPTEVKRVTFVWPQSNLLAPRLRQRIRISSAIAVRQGLRSVDLGVRGQTRLEQAFDVLTTAGWASLYLSVLNGVNPLAIDTVDELKRRLGASKK